MEYSARAGLQFATTDPRRNRAKHNLGVERFLDSCMKVSLSLELLDKAEPSSTQRGTGTRRAAPRFEANTLHRGELGGNLFEFTNVNKGAWRIINIDLKSTARLLNASLV